MSFRSAVFLVVANMVGVGVFTTSGFALHDLGHPAPVLVAWLMGGAIALCGALCYGALARSIPQSGGEYVYLRETVHPVAGFVAGWVSLLAGFAAPIAAAALTLSAYLGLTDPLGVKIVATGAVLGAGVLHGLRKRPGVVVQDLAVALKLVAIVVFVGWGATQVSSPEPTTPPLETWDAGAFAVTLVWVSFAYSGWNAAAYVAAEVDGGGRQVERALLVGTGVVMALYLALNAVFVWAAPTEVLAGQANIGSVAAEALGGPTARIALSGLVALALLTSVSSMVMAGPRVTVEMAKDGLLPEVLATNKEAPSWAVVFQVTLAVLLCWVTTLRELLSMIGFALGLCAAATVLGFLWWRRGQDRATTRVWGDPVVPVLFVVATLGASAFMAWREPTALAVVAVMFALGGLSASWRREQNRG